MIKKTTEISSWKFAEDKNSSKTEVDEKLPALSVSEPFTPSTPSYNGAKTPSTEHFSFSPFSVSSDDAGYRRVSINDPNRRRTSRVFFPEGASGSIKLGTQRHLPSSSQTEEKASNRRRSISQRLSFHRASDVNLAEDERLRQLASRKSLKRHSVFQTGKTLTKTAESTSDFNIPSRSSLMVDGATNEELQQRWWKNRNQLQAMNQRMSLNRLRVSQQQDLLNDLKMRRKTRLLPPRRPIRPIKISTPLDRFRRIVRLVRLLIRCLVDYQRVTVVSQSNQMSFAMLSNDMVTARTYRHGLTFDPSNYRVAKETLLNEKLREILTIIPHLRTRSQVEYALKCLRADVEEFAEFPLNMQQALVKVAWLDEFEPKRVIIRQGHKAETFYFILYGTALVTRNRISSNGEGYVETVSILKRGKSFGELAIMRREQRTNNVVSQTRLALLTVGRRDFVEIFMHRMEDGEPEFIRFLRKIPEFEGFPLNKVPRNKPTICAFTYFRVGVVICADSSDSDVIVIVRSGVCRVLKRLRAAKPNLRGLKEVVEKSVYKKDQDNYNSNVLTYQTFGQQRPVVLTSPTSPVSLLVGPKHPTLKKRFTLSLIQSGKPSLSSEPGLKAQLALNQSVSFFQKSNKRNLPYQSHKRQIWNCYKQWQEKHPISRETFALLLTGKDLNDVDSDDKHTDDTDDNEGDEMESKLAIKNQINSYLFKRSSNQELSDGSLSRKSSIQSNFRAHILKRNRSSLADMWAQQSAKVSTTSTGLPTVSEGSSSRRNKTSNCERNPSGLKADKQMFIHVQTLREGDVFGLLPIVCNSSEGATSVSLISDGAECILISREFFLKHFDNEQRERLIRLIQPYPSDEVLQANVQNQTNWDAYKFMTVHSIVVERTRLKKSRLY